MLGVRVLAPAMARLFALCLGGDLYPLIREGFSFAKVQLIRIIGIADWLRRFADRLLLEGTLAKAFRGFFGFVQAFGSAG